MISALRGSFNRFTGCGYHLIEPFRVVDRHFGEHFAIDTDLGQFQAIDKLTVSDIPLGAGRRNTDNPERAEITFASSSVLGRSGPGAEKRLFY